MAESVGRTIEVNGPVRATRRLCVIHCTYSVGVDGDFARYKGSMYFVHEMSGSDHMDRINLGGTAGVKAPVPCFARGRSFLRLSIYLFFVMCTFNK